MHLMDNIVYIDFSRGDRSPELNDYINHLRELGLDEDDVLDVIDCINDMTCYFDADDDIKLIVEHWLQQYV